MFDVLVRGGQVVCAGSVVETDVGIQDGRIAGLLGRGAEAQASQVIDAAGKVVIPGAIDGHLHIRNFDHQVDSFETASLAAAHGGITTVVAFVKSGPSLSVPDSVEHFRREGETTSVCDFALHAWLTIPDRKFIQQIPEALARGVTTFKVMMDYRKRGIMWDDYHLMAIMEAVAQADAQLLIHAEDGMIIDYREDKLLAEGRYLPTTFLASRPNLLEANAVARAASLAEMAGCRLHVVHLSAREGLEEILRAKARGVRLTTETCPQYLLLTDSIMAKLQGRAKIGPPLREEPDLEAMWAGLRTGGIEMVASDHAACNLAEKDQPPEHFIDVPFGMPGVETMLPLLYSEGVQKGRLSLPRLVDALCTQPARIHGLYPRKGTIQVGSDADLVILDPRAEWQIQAANLHSRSGYSAYDGWTLKGKPVLSLLRGQVLLQDGQLRQTPGGGRFLARTTADFK